VQPTLNGPLSQGSPFRGRATPPHGVCGGATRLLGGGTWALSGLTGHLSLAHPSPSLGFWSATTPPPLPIRWRLGGRRSTQSNWKKESPLLWVPSSPSLSLVISPARGSVKSYARREFNSNQYARVLLGSESGRSTSAPLLDHRHEHRWAPYVCETMRCCHLWHSRSYERTTTRTWGRRRVRRHHPRSSGTLTAFGFQRYEHWIPPLQHYS
jgi:hypothetical protein